MNYSPESIASKNVRNAFSAYALVEDGAAEGFLENRAMLTSSPETSDNMTSGHVIPLVPESIHEITSSFLQSPFHSSKLFLQPEALGDERPSRVFLIHPTRCMG